MVKERMRDKNTMSAVIKLGNTNKNTNGLLIWLFKNYEEAKKHAEKNCTGKNHDPDNPFVCIVQLCEDKTVPEAYKPCWDKIVEAPFEVDCVCNLCFDGDDFLLIEEDEG